MNQFLNPIMALPFIKHFLFDKNRIYTMTSQQLENFRDKSLRKIVKYAYTVPMYHKIYKKAGIHPNDIKGIQDIEKLPYISKKDIIDHFPNDIIPKRYNKKKGYQVYTSGSTGKPVAIYTDFQTMSEAVGIFLRELDIFDLHWRKSKFAIIGNFSPNKAPEASDKLINQQARSFFPLDNYLTLRVFDPIQEIIEKLDEFKPDIIFSIPVFYRNLAFFKKKGFGDNINTKVLHVGGYVLDNYTRKYVEDVFGCRMLNSYGSTESNADMAFECMQGTWHIFHDFFHIEAIDKNRELVKPGTRGHAVITRLFGRGTPIIRYTGVDDWITLSSDYKCDCGLCTPIITDGVEGRINTSVVTPDGRIFPIGSFDIISKVLMDLNTYKIKQYQIIQKKVDEIDILLVIDKDMRNLGPSVDHIMKELTTSYENKVGPRVKITVREVQEIQSSADKPLPLIISHLKPEEIQKIIESKN